MICSGSGVLNMLTGWVTSVHLEMVGGGSVAIDPSNTRLFCSRTPFFPEANITNKGWVGLIPLSRTDLGDFENFCMSSMSNFISLDLEMLLCCIVMSSC